MITIISIMIMMIIIIVIIIITGNGLRSRASCLAAGCCADSPGKPTAQERGYTYDIICIYIYIYIYICDDACMLAHTRTDTMCILDLHPIFTHFDHRGL